MKSPPGRQRAQARVRRWLRGGTTPAGPVAPPEATPDPDTDPSTPFERLLGAVVERWLGEPSDTFGQLPRTSFPELPEPPLGPALPDDLTVRHWSNLLDGQPLPPDGRVLDFGCGAANRKRWADGYGLDWWGLDIPDSQEAQARSDRDRVVLYDGRRIPLADASFAAVLSVQVFEHVPEPPLTLRELARVTVPGGYLVGSTSFCEPFHSRSTYGYSPWWFAKLLVDAGYEPVILAPGIDMLSLGLRRVARQSRLHEDVSRFDRYFDGPSPLFEVIDEVGRRMRVEPPRINALKLELAGHFHFLARRLPD